MLPGLRFVTGMTPNLSFVPGEVIERYRWVDDGTASWSTTSLSLSPFEEFEIAYEDPDYEWRFTFDMSCGNPGVTIRFSYAWLNESINGAAYAAVKRAYVSTTSNGSSDGFANLQMTHHTRLNPGETRKYYISVDTSGGTTDLVSPGNFIQADKIYMPTSLQTLNTTTWTTGTVPTP